MKKMLKLALASATAFAMGHTPFTLRADPAVSDTRTELTSIAQFPGGYNGHAVFGPMEYVPEVDMNAPLSPNKQVADAQSFLRTIDREIRKLLWEIEDLASNTTHSTEGMVTAINLRLSTLNNFARANGMQIVIHKRDLDNALNAIPENTGTSLENNGHVETNQSYFVTIKFADNAPAALLNNATFRFIFKWGISHTSGNKVLIPNGLGCMTDWEETESSGIWHKPLESTDHDVELKHGRAMHGGVSPRSRDTGGIWANCLTLDTEHLKITDDADNAIVDGVIGIHTDNLSWVEVPDTPI